MLVHFFQDVLPLEFVEKIVREVDIASLKRGNGLRRGVLGWGLVPHPIAVDIWNFVVQIVWPNSVWRPCNWQQGWQLGICLAEASSNFVFCIHSAILIYRLQTGHLQDSD